MKMTKGSEQSYATSMSKSNPPSPGNNPEASKTAGTAFSGKNCPKGSSSTRHSSPAAKVGG